jgi:hypothetical protein
MMVTPWLVAFAPVIDLADPPPRPPPPKALAASRLSAAAGIGLTDDIGWEIDLGVIASGYLVAITPERSYTTGTVWTQLQATHYMPAESEMISDRYWIGPFIRGGLGTEISGRYGLDPGALQRADFSLGLRGDAELGISAAFGLGWAVVHDTRQQSWTQGMQLYGELMWR